MLSSVLSWITVQVTDVHKRLSITGGFLQHRNCQNMCKNDTKNSQYTLVKFEDSAFNLDIVDIRID